MFGKTNKKDCELRMPSKFAYMTEKEIEYGGGCWVGISIGLLGGGLFTYGTILAATKWARGEGDSCYNAYNCIRMAAFSVIFYAIGIRCAYASYAGSRTGVWGDTSESSSFTSGETQCDDNPILYRY